MQNFEHEFEEVLDDSFASEPQNSSDWLNWNEPKAIEQIEIGVPELDLEMIPEQFRDFVTDVSTRMECAPDYVAVALLVVLGQVIGTACGIKPKLEDDWTVIPNIWGAAVKAGRTGWYGWGGVPSPPGSQRGQPASTIGRLNLTHLRFSRFTSFVSASTFFSSSSNLLLCFLSKSSTAVSTSPTEFFTLSNSSCNSDTSFSNCSISSP